MGHAFGEIYVCSDIFFFLLFPYPSPRSWLGREGESNRSWCPFLYHLSLWPNDSRRTFEGDDDDDGPEDDVSDAPALRMVLGPVSLSVPL